ncbi:MAG TPA: helix-turn-helix domain-containing protein [Verrucomicrobiae bacterium]
MKSKANEVVLTALQQVVGATLKSWLDENKAEVIQAVRAAVAIPQVPPPATRTTAAEPKREPEYLKVAEVAARWKLHPETVRDMVRQERLPRMRIGGRILVPMSAIAECEKQGWVPSRR